MAAAVDLSIFRLRFHGHETTLNAMWRAFNERPRQALTVGELVDITGLPIEDIHARLSQTPELFLRLPPKPRTNTRYRLALRVERLSADATAAYIHSFARSERLIRGAVVAAVVSLLVLFAVMDVMLKR